MARLRREPPDARQRLLHPGPRTGLRLESICETCTYFQASIEFRPTVQAQHDHAATHGQPGRQQPFGLILSRIDQDAS
jgi:hypothetical protein